MTWRFWKKKDKDTLAALRAELSRVLLEKEKLCRLNARVIEGLDTDKYYYVRVNSEEQARDLMDSWSSALGFVRWTGPPVAAGMFELHELDEECLQQLLVEVRKRKKE